MTALALLGVDMEQVLFWARAHRHLREVDRVWEGGSSRLLSNQALWTRHVGSAIQSRQVTRGQWLLFGYW